jgi:hypothetical protein
MADRVPETTDAEPNRAQRRHPGRTEDTPNARDVQPETPKTGSDDDVSVRAKSSGHKKKTADKWNQ